MAIRTTQYEDLRVSHRSVAQGIWSLMNILATEQRPETLDLREFAKDAPNQSSLETSSHMERGHGWPDTDMARNN